MFCPHCGHEVMREARFCPECGRSLSDAIPEGDRSLAPHVPGADSEGPRAHGKSRRVLIIAIVLVVCALAGAGILAARAALTRNTAAVPVTFTASVPGYDEQASRIPVHITGTTADGEDVDLTTYLARSGVDVELARGSYTMSVLGSPITSAGLMYEIPAEPLTFDVTSPEPGEEGCTIEEVLVLTPRDAAEVTDEEIADAAGWARRDELADVDADALENAARDRRERAQAGENVDADLARPALPGDVSA